MGKLVQRAARARVESGQDPYSPWADTRAFRVNGDGHDLLSFTLGERELELPVRFTRRDTVLSLPDGPVSIREERIENGKVSCLCDGVYLGGSYLEENGRAFVIRDGRTLELVDTRTLHQDDEESGSAGAVKAPMPGKIIAVLVSEGDAVQKGQALLRLEAMKMEHTLGAALDARVASLSVRVGDQVEEGSTLLVLASGEES